MQTVSETFAGTITVNRQMRLALPRMAMSLLIMSYLVADGVLISRFVGTTALSALSMSYPLTALLIAAGFMIAAGGGVVKRSENIAVLKNGGIIVFIDRLPEKIVQDIDTESRPLLAAGRQKVFDLYAERIELYRRYHDHIIDNNGEREAALQALLELARRES